MESIEEDIDSIRMFAVMARVNQVVRDVTSRPSEIVIEPEYMGEIIIKVAGSEVAKAKRQFSDDQVWDIFADERLVPMLRSPKLF